MTTDETQPAEYVWIVQQNSDLTEGRGHMKNVAICSSDYKALNVNYSVSGVQGVPAHFGGDIAKVRLDSFPIERETVWGYRKDWNGVFGMGWTDLRDKPDEDDPEWIEYQRLRDKFGQTKVEDRV